jgi:hypothetical protein
VSGALQALNARVRRTFDPEGVFVSPAMASADELAHA